MILIANLILYSCDLCVKISKFSLYSHIVPQTFTTGKYLISILLFISHGIWFFHSTSHIGRTIHAFYSVKTTKLELGDSPQFYCHASTSLDNIDIVKWSPKKKKKIELWRWSGKRNIAILDNEFNKKEIVTLKSSLWSMPIGLTYIYYHPPGNILWVISNIRGKVWGLYCDHIIHRLSRNFQGLLLG